MHRSPLAVASIEACEDLLADLRAVVIDESFAAEFQKSAGVGFQRRQILSPQSWLRRWLPPKNPPASRPNRKLPPQHIAAEVAEFNRQKIHRRRAAPARARKGQSRQDERDRIAGRSAQGGRYAHRRRSCGQAEERAKFDAEQRRPANTKRSSGRPRKAEEKSGATPRMRRGRQEESRKMARRAASISNPEAHRRRAGSTGRRGAGAGGDHAES